MSQESAVQELLSSQSRPLTASHDPATHRSPTLQMFPSSHALLSGSEAFLQPVSGSHVSFVHWFPSLHETLGPAVHAPLWHESFCVQTSPSVHPVPSTLFGFEQA